MSRASVVAIAIVLVVGLLAFKVKSVDSVECSICRVRRDQRKLFLVTDTLLITNKVIVADNEMSVWYNAKIDPAHIHDWHFRISNSYNAFGKLMRCSAGRRGKFSFIEPRHEQEFLENKFSQEQIKAIASALRDDVFAQLLINAIYGDPSRRELDILIQAAETNLLTQ
jgi:hypothetical protein